MRGINTLTPVLLFALLLMALGLASTPAAAQISTSFSASATVIAPIGVTKQGDLNFGSFLPSSTNPGTVTIGGTGAVSATNVTYAGGGSPAAFQVSGQPNRAFSVLVPASGALTRVSGSEQMAISFGSSYVNGGISRALDDTGANTFAMGAQLQVNTNQAPGAYTGSFAVVVSY